MNEQIKRLSGQPEESREMNSAPTMCEKQQMSMSYSERPENQIVQECRICLGRTGPFIQPCDCKGSIAFVHKSCLSRWLESRLSLKCDICGFNIEQSLELKSPREIMRGLLKLLIKKVRKDKWVIFKVIIYYAYMVLSCKQASALTKLLISSIR